VKQSKQSKRHARERLQADIDDAVRIATAEVVSSWADDSTAIRYARVLYATRHELRHAVMKVLARNWRVSERARPQRSTGGDA
jgi:hypothetical protein